MRIEAQCKNFKFWLTLTKTENKLSQIAYNDIKWNENRALWSKKIKRLLEQIGLGELWMKAHYADIGIVDMISQGLKDIELQRWLSEINNDNRKDANQSNKMKTYRLFKTIEYYRCEDNLHQVTNMRHRIALTKLRLSNHKLAIETGRYCLISYRAGAWHYRIFPDFLRSPVSKWRIVGVKTRTKAIFFEEILINIP